MTPRFNVPLLLDMLTYARPMGSITERAFCTKFIAPIPGAYADEKGNWHIKIGDDPKILWSCHTDTVHRLAGRQTLHYDPRSTVVRLSKRSQKIHTCLGADDTAGVAIFAQMAAAKIPGHYVFHYGEERGGIGSDWLVDNYPTWLQTFRAAIAVDRKGFSDVITHQYGRCCSDVFAESLAAHLNTRGMDYKPSDRGVFTDTANYTDDIGECTNLSCGYFDAHRDIETLHVSHVIRLFNALCSLDPDSLTYSREAGEADPDDTRWVWLGKSQEPSYTSIESHWPDTIDALADGAVVELAECNGCYSDFDPALSTALDTDNFCTIECEHKFFSLFLDQSAARAQNEIRAQLRRVK